jgi:hypothetical protein
VTETETGGGVPCKCCGELRWPGTGAKPGEGYTCQRCRASCGYGHPWHASDRHAKAARRRVEARRRGRKGKEAA